MPRYVAFLRAINVGGRVVTMEALRGHFGGAGFAGVETFIASGNVIFDAKAKAGPALEKRIETVLREALGFEVPTFVRALSDVVRASERQVYPEPDVAAASALLVGLMKGPLDAAAARRLAALNSDLHTFRSEGAELYWLCKVKQSESKLTPAQIERALGGPVTLRAISSARKLVAKHCTTGG